jgi:prepilin-type N-terminal cleavage/methylation domain-containing protein
MIQDGNGNLEKGFSLIEIMVVGAIISILLAVAIPYYMAYQRDTCDRAAQADLHNLYVSFERFQSEADDLNCNINQLCSHIEVGWLTGPYYGWGGSNNKCSVVMRKVDNEIWACALHGSQPLADPSYRYIYRLSVPGGTDLPVIRDECWGDRYGGPAQACFTSSIIRRMSATQCEVKEPSTFIECAKVKGTH